MAGLAAASGALADGRPAGWVVADVVFRAAFALCVTLVFTRARRWSWITSTTVTAVAATGSPAIVPALAGFGFAMAAVVGDRRRRLLGALAGALSAQALLRLPDLGFTGASAVVVSLAVLPVGVSAYRRADEAHRRVLWRVVAGSVTFAAVAAVGLAVAVAVARDPVEAGIDHARLGFEAARAGDSDAAAEELGAASTSFETAHTRLTAPWARMARLVPILGNHAAALDAVTGAGADLAETASVAASDADVDRLRFDDGRLDLTVVAELLEPLQRAETSLAEAAGAADRVASPWLLTPVADRLATFEEEVDRALPDARLARHGVEVAPGLLGGTEPRHYLLAFVTPSENRGLGGFVGSYGELSAVDGDLELTRSGSAEELILAARRSNAVLHGPPEYLARYGRFDIESYLGDATLSPDMPAVAQVLEDLYPQAGGRAVDGVIVVDPVALAALLNFTGPIEVPGLDVPLTPDNAADILLRDQYLTFDQRSGRQDFLEDATRLTFEALTAGDLPGPRELADVMGPAVDQGRMMMHAVRPPEQDFATEVGIDGGFPRPDGGDLIGLVTSNRGNNKIDIFMERTLDYRATYDPLSGRVAAEATVRIANEAPSSGLPDVILANRDQRAGGDTPLGTNEAYVSLYSPLALESVVRRAGDQDEPQAIESQREFGVWVYSTVVEVGPGATQELVFRLRGSIEPSTEYRLTVANQPTVRPDGIRVAISPPSTWRAEAGDAGRLRGRAAVFRLDPTEGDGRVRVAMAPR